MGESKRRADHQTPIERVAQDVSRQLANQGKVIEGGWAAHSLLFITPDTPPATVDALCFAYMAGSQHLWASIMVSVDPEAEPTAADMGRMTKIEAELAAWAAEAARYHCPTKWSA